jgi:hypothetical protein
VENPWGAFRKMKRFAGMSIPFFKMLKVISPHSLYLMRKKLTSIFILVKGLKVREFLYLW